MIESLEVHDFQNLYKHRKWTFHKDVNILTGRNGSGKTSLMKLMWYMMAGVQDNSVKISEAILESEKEKRIKWEYDKDYIGHYKNTNNLGLDFIDVLRRGISFPINTYFFPTFRRTEGGFDAILKKANQENLWGREFQQISFEFIFTDSSLGSKFIKHEFIYAYSTQDLENKLRNIYAQISAKNEILDKEQADYILNIANNGENGDLAMGMAKIKQKIEEINAKKAVEMRPITVISDLVNFFFKERGVKIWEKMTLGKIENAISSESLSAGEKQMLSFLIYCALAKDSVIFIDEPEISLHPDWQRKLIPALLELGNGNQYFIATHSPFIYAMYPDKEIMLNPDKGE